MTTGSLFDDILLGYSLLVVEVTFVAICAAIWIAEKIQGPPKTSRRDGQIESERRTGNPEMLRLRLDGRR